MFEPFGGILINHAETIDESFADSEAALIVHAVNRLLGAALLGAALSRLLHQALLSRSCFKGEQVRAKVKSLPSEVSRLVLFFLVKDSAKSDRLCAFARGNM